MAISQFYREDQLAAMEGWVGVCLLALKAYEKRWGEYDVAVITEVQV